MDIKHDGMFHKLMNGLSLGLMHDQLEGFWAEVVNGLNTFPGTEISWSEAA